MKKWHYRTIRQLNEEIYDIAYNQNGQKDKFLPGLALSMPTASADMMKMYARDRDLDNSFICPFIMVASWSTCTLS